MPNEQVNESRQHRIYALCSVNDRCYTNDSFVINNLTNELMK